MTDFEKLTDKVEGLIADVALNHIQTMERLDLLEKWIHRQIITMCTIAITVLLVVLVRP